MTIWLEPVSIDCDADPAMADQVHSQFGDKCATKPEGAGPGGTSYRYCTATAGGGQQCQHYRSEEEMREKTGATIDEATGKYKMPVTGLMGTNPNLNSLQPNNIWADQITGANEIVGGVLAVALILCVIVITIGSVGFATERAGWSGRSKISTGHIFAAITAALVIGMLGKLLGFSLSFGLFSW